MTSSLLQLKAVDAAKALPVELSPLHALYLTEPGAEPVVVALGPEPLIASRFATIVAESPGNAGAILERRNGKGELLEAFLS